MLHSSFSHFHQSDCSSLHWLPKPEGRGASTIQFMFALGDDSMFTDE
jgi:hypothetical protein